MRYANRSFQIVVALVVMAPIWFVAMAGTAHACHDVKVCVWWDPQYNDSDGATQDFLISGGGPAPDGMGANPARGLRVTIMPPPPEAPIGGYLDEEGCITYQTQYTHGHKMVVYAESLMGVESAPGAGDGDNVYLRVLDVDAYLFNEDDPSDSWDDEAEYAFGLTLGGLNEFAGPGDEVAAYVPVVDLGDDGARVINGLAAMSETFYRLGALGLHIPTTYSLRLRWDPEGPGGGGVNGRITLCADQELCDHSGNKFVVSHETGHNLQDLWGKIIDPTESGLGVWPVVLNPVSGLTVGTYEYLPVDADGDCTFWPIHGAAVPDAFHHGLLSAEESRAALIEGFAQFVAAISYNDPADDAGTFKYYKDVAHLATEFPGSGWDALVLDANNVSLADGSIGVADAWVMNACGPPPGNVNDWDWPYSGSGPYESLHISSEIDWLRMFWRYVADDDYAGEPAGTVVELFDVVVRTAMPAMAGGNEYSPNPWVAMDNAAAAELSPGAAARLSHFADELKVYNDGT